MYRNILSITAQRRPVIGYVQGMADLLVPFVFVFKESEENLEITESSAYYCFTKFIENLQDNFVDSQIGIFQNIKKMADIVQIIDPELVLHLNNLNLEFHMFAFRWFNCFYTREFKMEDLLIIFDTLFSLKSQRFNDFSLYFGVALLEHFRDVLIGNDFNFCMTFLQGLSEKKWKLSEIHLLLASAFVYQNIFLKM